jgi:hypothetical protein
VLAYLARPAAQAVELAEECQPAHRMGVGEPRQEEPPEQAGQHAHRQQEAGSHSLGLVCFLFCMGGSICHRWACTT